jgi:hypothetical protein
MGSDTNGNSFLCINYFSITYEIKSIFQFFQKILDNTRRY